MSVYMHCMTPQTAPLPPVVTISVSGDSVAGSSLSLLCTATPPIPLMTPPTISWVGVVSSDDVTVTNSLTVLESNTMVTFNPLRTSRGGVYMCVAGYNIPAADISSSVQNSDSTTVNVQSKCVWCGVGVCVCVYVCTVLTLCLHAVSTVAPTPRGVPFDSDFNTGLELDLVCRLELDPAVDSPLTVTSTWVKDNRPLVPDGARLTFTDAIMNGTTPPLYMTSVLFRTLNARLSDSGNYTCSFSIVPNQPTYITGTTATVSRDIIVEGQHAILSLYVIY